VAFINVYQAPAAYYPHVMYPCLTRANIVTSCFPSPKVNKASLSCTILRTATLSFYAFTIFEAIK
jgi:hypothetical protein